LLHETRLSPLHALSYIHEHPRVNDQGSYLRVNIYKNKLSNTIIYNYRMSQFVKAMTKLARSGKIAGARYTAGRFRKPVSYKTVKKLINKNVEYKFKDTTVVDTDIAATLRLLNGMQQGDTPSARDGRKITVKSIEIDGLVKAVDEPNMSRHMLVYDKQANGAAPVVTDILDSSSVYGLRNLDNRSRFIILWDYKIPLPMGEREVNNREYRKLKYYKRHNLQTIYNSGNAGTIADISTGALYYLSISDTVLTAGAEPEESIQIRIRFTDD